MTATAAMTSGRRTSEPLIALGLAAGPVVALGFTRFAYALLLPAMHDQLHWTFAAAGGMNTANAIGYILGAATSAWWARRLGGSAAFIWSLLISGVMLLATAVTGNYAALAAIRFVGGVSTAITFVVGSALAARIHTGNRRHRPAMLVAIYMAGVGIGIVLSGVVIPATIAGLGTAGWRFGWLAMGILAALALPPAIWAARRTPAPAVAAAGGHEKIRLGPLAPTFVWYVLFGAGYVSYMTFVIALLHSEGLHLGAQAAFFIVLGIASVIGTLTVWSRITGRLRQGHAPALVSVIVLIGVLPVLIWQGLAAALLSAIIFGATFMAGPTAATVLARRLLPAHNWTAGIALLTVAFSVGQAIGPLVSGLLSDTSGGITKGLWLSVILLGVAAVVALLQRDRPALPPAATTPPGAIANR
ncbi:YbfB/YjiJ family MFS transporter [Micromonospora coerulea]|uniref:YbfB/YjiJ family MFS transporter n=1 Tax=Micromonospora coerulea TaxID=47856 RepID=A0ABP8SQK6_9ACTN